MTDVNTPFIKEYKNGEISNFPHGGYFNYFPNRQTRRQKPQRFNNNRNSFPLVISGPNAFVKLRQYTFDKKTKEPKIIYHYLPKPSNIY